MGPDGERTADQTVAGVKFLELFDQGADDSSPLIVALHGRGGGPVRFARTWHDFPVKVEIALAQAPLPYSYGSQWFDWPPGLTDDQLADRVSAAETALWPAIVQLAHGRRVIVAGFSQGAVLAYVIAARHQDQVAYAFPIAGLLPHKLEPHSGAKTAPVYALHGTADDSLPVHAARNAIAAFKAAGATAELKEFTGAGHTISPEMRDDLIAHLRPLLAPSAAMQH